MTNLETTLNFFSKVLTENELTNLKLKAIDTTSIDEATYQGLPYITHLYNNLIALCFDTYKIKYEDEMDD
jgi:hypothetical protein